MTGTSEDDCAGEMAFRRCEVALDAFHVQSVLSIVDFVLLSSRPNYTRPFISLSASCLPLCLYYVRRTLAKVRACCAARWREVDHDVWHTLLVAYFGFHDQDTKLFACASH
jgi:hypothetical protein